MKPVSSFECKNWNIFSKLSLASSLQTSSIPLPRPKISVDNVMLLLLAPGAGITRDMIDNSFRSVSAIFLWYCVGSDWRFGVLMICKSEHVSSNAILSMDTIFIAPDCRVCLPTCTFSRMVVSLMRATCHSLVSALQTGHWKYESHPRSALNLAKQSMQILWEHGDKVNHDRSSPWAFPNDCSVHEHFITSGWYV